MSRGDATGVPHTCPTIDSIIAYAEDLRQYAEPGKIITKQDAADMNGTIDEMSKFCEDVRSANEQLRDFGIEQHETAGEAVAKIEELDDELGSLEAERDDLKADNENQLNKLDELQQQLDQLSIHN